MLAPSRGARSRSSLEGAVTGGTEESPVFVLPSSTELFYFYGQNLEQCAKLSNRKPLFDLCNLHKKWLRIYAGTEAHLHDCLPGNKIFVTDHDRITAEDVLFSSIKG